EVVGLWYEEDFYIPVVHSDAYGSLEEMGEPVSAIEPEEAPEQDWGQFANVKKAASIYLQLLQWLYRVSCNEYLLQVFPPKPGEAVALPTDLALVATTLKDGQDDIFDMLEEYVVVDASKKLDITRIWCRLDAMVQREQVIDMLKRED